MYEIDTISAKIKYNGFTKIITRPGIVTGIDSACRLAELKI